MRNKTFVLLVVVALLISPVSSYAFLEPGSMKGCSGFSSPATGTTSSGGLTFSSSSSSSSSDSSSSSSGGINSFQSPSAAVSHSSSSTLGSSGFSSIGITSMPGITANNNVRATSITGNPASVSASVPASVSSPTSFSSLPTVSSSPSASSMAVNPGAQFASIGFSGITQSAQSSNTQSAPSTMAAPQAAVSAPAANTAPVYAANNMIGALQVPGINNGQGIVTAGNPYGNGAANPYGLQPGIENESMMADLTSSGQVTPISIDSQLPVTGQLCGLVFPGASSGGNAQNIQWGVPVGTTTGLDGNTYPVYNAGAMMTGQPTLYNDPMMAQSIASGKVTPIESTPDPSCAFSWVSMDSNGNIVPGGVGPFDIQSIPSGPGINLQQLYYDKITKEIEAAMQGMQ